MSPRTPPSRVSRLGIGAALLGLAGCDAAAPGADSADPEGWVTADRPDLVVTVTSDAGPLPGAWVSLTPSGREAVTGDDGTARLSQLDDGTYTVLADAAGFVGAVTVTEIAGADATLTLALDAEATGATLAGTVVGPDDLAVEGASVQLDGAEIAVTDASGAWLAEGLDGGAHAVEVVPSSPLRPWSSPRVELPEQGTVTLSVVVAGGPTDAATFMGSSYCLYCHAGADTWSDSAHANVARSPADAEAADAPSGLAAAFAAGDSVGLDDAVPGARVVLGYTGEGAWTARVEDAAGATTGDLEVVEVYGGLSFGAALAVDAGGTRAILPVAWALDGQGLGSAQADADWVVAWTDGWFDTAGNLSLSSGAPGAAASWDLRCGGCHATGAKLQDDGGGRYSLVRVAGVGNLERVVGCEACHGPGSDHVAAVSTGTQVRYVLNPADLPAWERPQVCARCHARVEDGTHPFTDAPGFAVADDGALLSPFAVVEEEATLAPSRWLAADASRVHRDQSGDFGDSPHRQGPDGYDGTCEDCHSAHGGDHDAALLRDPGDNTLCTSCHASRFPDEAAESAHSGHTTFDPGLWSPGSCVGCHFPRTGLAVRADAVSGAGEARAHVLGFLEPEVALAEFDAAGTDTLPLGSVPPSACLDCHEQADAEADDGGANCPCPVSNPTKRSTYEDFQALFDIFRGMAE